MKFMEVLINVYFCLIVSVVDVNECIFRVNEQQKVYYLHQIEKNNCLSETELASGKTLKSCEIILKAVFLLNAWNA